MLWTVIDNCVVALIVNDTILIDTLLLLVQVRFFSCVGKNPSLQLRVLTRYDVTNPIPTGIFLKDAPLWTAIAINGGKYVHLSWPKELILHYGDLLKLDNRLFIAWILRNSYLAYLLFLVKKISIQVLKIFFGQLIFNLFIQAP